MLAEHARDAAATAAVFGFFASAWFGWAQDSPPASWRWALVVGSLVSLAVCAAGVLLTWRRWSDPTALDAQTSRAFGIVVGIEFALAGLGAGVLVAVGKADLVPAWVAIVVGLHLFPLAALLDYRLLHVTASLLVVVGLAAVPVARAASLPVSAVTGACCGVVLLATALLSLATVSGAGADDRPAVTSGT